MANILERLVNNAKKKKEEVEGLAGRVYDQVNPLDGGKSFQTRQVAPPTQPRYSPVGRNDNQPGFQVTNNSVSRGLSRGLDQFNPFDNNRTWQQRAPTQQKSTFQQAGQLSGQVARAATVGTTRALNTAAAQIPQAYYTGAQQIAARTKNPIAYRNATNKVEAANDMFGKTGGLMNTGTFYNSDEARSGDLKTGLKRIGGGIAESGLEVGTLGVGGIVGRELAKQGIKQGLKTQAPRIVANTALNTTQGGVSAYNQDASVKDIAKSAAFSGLIGTAADVGLGVGGAVASAGARKAAAPAIDRLRNANIIRPANLNPAEVADLTTFRQQAGTGAMMDDATYQRGITAAQKAGVDYRDPSAVDNLLGAFRNYDTNKPQLTALNQGGYAKVLFANDDLAPGLSKKQKEFINEYAEALEGMDAGNGVNINKETGVRSTSNSPTYSRLYAENKGKPSKLQWFDEARQQLESGKAEYGASDDYKAIPGVKPKKQSPKSEAPVLEQKTAGSSEGSIAPTLDDALAGNSTIIKKPTQFADQDYTPPANPSKTPTRTDFPDESKLNTERLNLNDSQRAELGDETTEVIGKLSNKDVERIAKGAGMDTKSYSIDQTKQEIAKQLNVRKDAVRLMNEAEVAKNAGDKTKAITLMMEAAEQGKISRSQGTDLARQLQARKIIANELDTPQHRIFKLLDEAGINPEVYTKRLVDVDFNDGRDVVKAYRDLVPAKFGNWLDLVRYNSMLSSPLTQAVNVFGNAGNLAGIAPIEKTLRGTIDAVGGLFGKERRYAAGEGAAYASGAAKSIKQASLNFVDTLSGKKDLTNADLSDGDRLPLAIGGMKGAAYQGLSFPLRTLGAFDSLFRTMANAGEMNALNLREKKGIKIGGNKQALADSEAAYRVFQADSHIPGQGALLNAADGFADIVMGGRYNKSPIVSTVSKFTVPFVKTINNINKQGLVEYSPLGLVNMAGNTDKVTALTRAIMGTTVFGASALMLAGGDMTWAEPRDPDEKARFRAEGKQPYAIRVGDKWIGINKLAPAVSFPMAITAAIADAQKNSKLSDNTADQILGAIAKYGEFLSDQSYAKSVGDTLRGMQGDTEKVASAFSNVGQQLVPYRALTGWMARISDGVERKVDTSQSYVDQQVQLLMQNYPGLRQKTATRNYKGEPIKANNQVFNGFSPVKVTKDRGSDPLDTELDKLAEANQKDPLLSKSQVKEVDKRVDSMIANKQRELISSAEYKALDSKKQASSLNSLKSDLKAVERRKYMAENQVGEYAQNFQGKETKLSTSQKRLIEGKTVNYLSDADNKATYAEKLESAKKKYGEDKSGLSRLKQIKAEDEIRDLEVKKDYDEDTVGLYGMNKTNVYGFLNSDKDGKKLADKLIAYGDARVKAGLDTTNKFRDKNGNIAIQPKAKGTGRGRGGKGGKGGRTAKLKPSDFKLPFDNLIKSRTKGASLARSAKLAGKRAKSYA